MELLSYSFYLSVSVTHLFLHVVHVFLVRALNELIIVILNTWSDNSKMSTISKSGSEAYFVSSYFVFCLLGFILFYVFFFAENQA